MKYVRTPDERFNNLPDYPFNPNYVDVDCADGTTLRLHYLDEGPKEGPLVLCMHGQPTWSYLYRKMIPGFVDAGMRVIAPDLIGFGRSDKPTDLVDYTYAAHVNWMNSFVRKLDLTDVTLFCQDWGGLIGLRVVADNEARFARIVTANTALPDAKDIPDEEIEPMSKAVAKRYAEIPTPMTFRDMAIALIKDKSDLGFHHWDISPFFLHWVKYCALGSPSAKDNLALSAGLSEAEAAPYDAPFPGEKYMTGMRIFPSLVPIAPDDPAIVDNRNAWKILEKWEKPFLTLFGDTDPITAGWDKKLQKRIPGAAGQAHTTFKGAGHFIQEQVPEELVEHTIRFMKNT